MSSATQGMFLILSAICLFFGLSDLTEQYKAGEELRWTVPIILIGAGVGIPLVIFPLSEHLENSGSDEHDSEYHSDSDGDFGGSDGGE